MAKAHPIRRWVRELLSVSFWFHALCGAHIAPKLADYISVSVTRSIYNGLLLSFILYYSWLTTKGWLSACFDLAYIYVWPFIRASQALWKASRWFYRFFKAHTVAAPVGLITVPATTVSQIAADAETNKPTIKEAVDQYKSARKKKEPSLRARLLRPFNKFALLWAILLLSLTNRFCIALVLLVTLYGASKAVYALWDLLSDTSSWIEKLKSGFATQFADKMRQIREWEETVDPEALTKEINGLKVYESVFAFISANRNFLARCTTAAAVAITVPFYTYVSFLFASVYVGAAHLAHIQLQWTDALIDSLYIPFAFTDLPHNPVIRSVAGLQAIAITLMGWNVFFRHLGGRFERLATAAEELRLKFDDETYRSKSERVASIIQAKKTRPVAGRPNRKGRRAPARVTVQKSKA